METLFTFLRTLLSIISPARKRPKITIRSSEALYTTPSKVLGEQEMKSSIIIDDKEISIAWDKVVTYKTNPEWGLPEDNMKKRNSHRGVRSVVVHWDGCLDSEMCHRVITNRGLSVHFCIDTDGTIIQLMDANDIAWHARGVNTQSVGIEVANPVFLKYQDKENPRPIWKADKVHRREVPDRLGFYPVQEEALRALVQTLCGYYSLPIITPSWKGTIKDPQKFKGVLGHFHISTNKTDPLGFDFSKLFKK